MGVEYWLVDRGNKTFYDLGKGPWGWAGEDFLFAISDLECLTDALLEVYEESSRDELSDETKVYVAELAGEIHQHFGRSKEADLVIVMDGGDEMVIMKSKGYRGVGTRYRVDDFEKELWELNSHLTYRSHWYRPEDVMSYPGWDDW